jgi:hypothetical protein
MFNARPSVRNFREVIAPEFFLFFETKRAMIRRHNLQVVAFQSIPEFFLMPFFSQRRREHVFRTFKSRRVEVFDRQIQILRAGFRIYG